MFNFEELNEATRQAMFREFEDEQDSDPYVSPRLTEEGRRVHADLIRRAICVGNEVSLERDLADQAYWLHFDANGRRINFASAAKTLAITEFNAWYVRGLAKRLLDEGVKICEVYKADVAKEPRGECLQHEGAHYSVQEVYDGHRARYWPKPGNRDAFSIPAGPNCHHTIRRVRGDD